jgi:hypothetical protein
MFKILKTRATKTLCALAIGGSMLALQVPSAYAFVKCYTTICSDDGTLCITYQSPCPVLTEQ